MECFKSFFLTCLANSSVSTFDRLQASINLAGCLAISLTKKYFILTRFSIKSREPHDLLDSGEISGQRRKRSFLDIL